VDSAGGRHAEARHPVENVASNSRLGPLIGQSPGVESAANDDLVTKHRDLDQASSIVANVVRCQFHRDEFMRVGVHAKVKLPPTPVRPNTVLLIKPFAFAVNLETGTIDQEMQWFSAVNVLRQYCQAAGSSACRSSGR